MDKGFCACYEEFLALHRGGWRPVTHRVRLSNYLGIFAPHFRHTPLRKITPQDVARMLDRRNLRPSSRRAYLLALRQFWSWAKKNGYASHNPARAVPNGVARRRRPVPLTVVEAARVLAEARACPNPCAEAALATMLLTGLRLHNICALRPEHVQGELLVIPGELMKNHQDFVVPYHPQLEPVLRRLPWGMTRDRIKTLMARLRRLTGIGRLHSHLCRHTFGTWIARNTPEAVVAKLMGHNRENDSITALYIHVDVEQMRAALDQLPRLL